MEQEHKRRVRYKGTHPRKFEEKYKELNPEKYKADVEKIVQSGKTPAGTHIPIMVDEILEVLQIKPGGTTDDGMFTLDALRCIGACGIAPAVTINGKVYPKMTVDKVISVVEEYREKEAM